MMVITYSGAINAGACCVRNDLTGFCVRSRREAALFGGSPSVWDGERMADEGV